jgi:hypothetical protein
MRPPAASSAAPRDTAADADAAGAAAQDTTKPRARRAGSAPRRGTSTWPSATPGSDLDSLWPVKTPPPLPGSILPAKRVVAFYGNPLSKRMGILGEFEPEAMLRKLDAEVAAWNRSTPRTRCSPRCT